MSRTVPLGSELSVINLLSLSPKTTEKNYSSDKPTGDEGRTQPEVLRDVVRSMGKKTKTRDGLGSPMIRPWIHTHLHTSGLVMHEMVAVNMPSERAVPVQTDAQTALPKRKRQQDKGTGTLDIKGPRLINETRTSRSPPSTLYIWKWIFLKRRYHWNIY